MRAVRRQPADDALVCLSASDPANLLGTVLAGPRGAACTARRLRVLSTATASRLGTSVGGQIEMLVKLDDTQQRAATRALALDPDVRFSELPEARFGEIAAPVG